LGEAERISVPASPRTPEPQLVAIKQKWKKMIDIFRTVGHDVLIVRDEALMPNLFRPLSRE
jgi:hypothetical protein